MTSSPQSRFAGLENWAELGRDWMKEGYTKSRAKAPIFTSNYLALPLFSSGERKPFPSCCRETNEMKPFVFCRSSIVYVLRSLRFIVYPLQAK